MAEYVALGSAVLEADSAEVARDKVAFEDLDWQLRILCTAKEWSAISNDGVRPWVGKASFFTLPFIGWACTTGRVGPWEWWHPLVTLAEYSPLF